MPAAHRHLAVLFLLVQCSPSGADRQAIGEQPASAPPPSELPDEPLEKPVPGDPTRAAAAARRGLQAMQSARVDEAFQSFNEAVEADPALVDARLLRAQLLTSKSRYFNPQVALRDVRIAALVEPQNPAVIAAEGLLRYQLGQLARAAPLLKQFLALPPQPGSETTRGQVHESLALIALGEGRIDEADQHCAAAMQLEPTQPTPAYHRAQVAAQRGDATAELRWLDEALRLDPHHIPARQSRGRALARLGREPEAAAERELEEVLRKLADDKSYLFVNDHAAKAELWARVAELLPRDAKSRLNRLLELYLAQEYAKVVEAGEELLDQGALVPRVVAEIARAEAQLGHEQKALDRVEMLAMCQPPARAESIAALRKEVQAICASRAAGDRARGDHP